MYELSKSPDSVCDAIIRLNRCLDKHPELANRLGKAHAFYILEREGKKPKFGFSKFVGYENLTPQQYLDDYNKLDGRNTEHALSTWFDELKQNSPTYTEYYAHLVEWLAKYGKRPRGGESQQVRLMVLKSEYKEPRLSNIEDRRLLDLMKEVANILPANQRHELRAAL